MRVLVVHDYGIRLGGAEHLSFAIRDQLRARGHEARLFTSTAQPLALAIESDAHCHGSAGASRRFLQAWNPMARLGLARELADYPPDIVHVRMFASQLSPAILPLLRKWRALLHVVNYDLVCPLNTRVLPDGSACPYTPGRVCLREGCLSLAGQARAIVQRVQWQRFGDVFDRIICNSHRTRALLERHGVACDGVIWNGVPVHDPRPPLSPAAEPIVACAARLVEKKGVDWLLRSFVRVLREIPTARLWVLGDGPERGPLEKLSRTLGMAERVDWFGHLDRLELERVLASAWVQVVPSRWEEPFGLVAAEAMIRGTAVIASDGGGLAEQVVDGVTGHVVAVDDEQALARRLVDLLGLPERAERMGAAGRERALAEFTETHVVDRFLDLYAELLLERPSLA